MKTAAVILIIIDIVLFWYAIGLHRKNKRVQIWLKNDTRRNMKIYHVQKKQYIVIIAEQIIV
jgi:hypothetical protein